MKRNIGIGILVAVIVLIGLSIYMKNNTNKDSLSGSNNQQEEVYLVSSGNLNFSYESGENGYYLEDQDLSSSDEKDLITRIILTPTVDYIDQQNREGGEGSPSLSLSVYNNHLKQSSSVWVDANPQASNVNLIIGDLKEDVVGGANAVSYLIDGLYPTKMVVFASGGYIYVASGAYLDQESPTYRDFDSWISSFEFMEPKSVAVPQKINVQVACESALVYTTFMNGEDADKFVAECVAGEHPDVIERYISDMGVDGATI